MAEPIRCVALTGVTGFVGRHLLPHLLDAGLRVRALVRDRDRFNLSDSRVSPVEGDLFDDEALSDLMAGADAVVHLVGIIDEVPRLGQTFERVHTEGTNRLVAAAKTDGGIKRWVHMSALGARPDAAANYHITKWQAETAVRQSGIDYTVFRPSIIHGPDGEFMRDLVKPFCCNVIPPFMPYFGAGLFGFGDGGRVQPVWVEDVARCFTAALSNERAVNETYPLGGPDRYTFPQLYRVCQKHLPGAKPWKRPLPMPAWKAKMLSHFPLVPFNYDQVVMSQEESICDIAKAQNDFEIELAPFEETFAGYAAEV